MRLLALGPPRSVPARPHSQLVECAGRGGLLPAATDNTCNSGDNNYSNDSENITADISKAEAMQQLPFSRDKSGVRAARSRRWGSGRRGACSPRSAGSPGAS